MSEPIEPSVPGFGKRVEMGIHDMLRRGPARLPDDLSETPELASVHDELMKHLGPAGESVFVQVLGLAIREMLESGDIAYDPSTDLFSLLVEPPPSSAADVPTMTPEERARRQDDLLDRLDEERRPEVRRQIEERLRSVSASKMPVLYDVEMGGPDNSFDGKPDAQIPLPADFFDREYVERNGMALSELVKAGLVPEGTKWTDTDGDASVWYLMLRLPDGTEETASFASPLEDEPLESAASATKPRNIVVAEERISITAENGQTYSIPKGDLDRYIEERRWLQKHGPRVDNEGRRVRIPYDAYCEAISHGKKSDDIRQRIIERSTVDSGQFSKVVLLEILDRVSTDVVPEGMESEVRDEPLEGPSEEGGPLERDASGVPRLPPGWEFYVWIAGYEDEGRWFTDYAQAEAFFHEELADQAKGVVLEMRSITCGLGQQDEPFNWRQILRESTPEEERAHEDRLDDSAEGPLEAGFAERFRLKRVTASLPPWVEAATRMRAGDAFVFPAPVTAGGVRLLPGDEAVLITASIGSGIFKVVRAGGGKAEFARLPLSAVLSGSTRRTASTEEQLRPGHAWVVMEGGEILKVIFAPTRRDAGMEVALTLQADGWEGTLEEIYEQSGGQDSDISISQVPFVVVGEQGPIEQSASARTAASYDRVCLVRLKDDPVNVFGVYVAESTAQLVDWLAANDLEEMVDEFERYWREDNPEPNLTLDRRAVIHDTYRFDWYNLRDALPENEGPIEPRSDARGRWMGRRADPRSSYRLRNWHEERDDAGLSKRYKYSITYDVVTPESAEQGDFADTGFETEDAEGTLLEIAREAQGHGIAYRANYATGPAWQSHGDENYQTGESTTYTLFVDDLDANEAEELNALLGGPPPREWVESGGQDVHEPLEPRGSGRRQTVRAADSGAATLSRLKKAEKARPNHVWVVFDEAAHVPLAVVIAPDREGLEEVLSREEGLTLDEFRERFNVQQIIITTLRSPQPVAVGDVDDSPLEPSASARAESPQWGVFGEPHGEFLGFVPGDTKQEADQAALRRYGPIPDDPAWALVVVPASEVTPEDTEREVHGPLEGLARRRWTRRADLFRVKWTGREWYNAEHDIEAANEDEARDKARDIRDSGDLRFEGTGEIDDVEVYEVENLTEKEFGEIGGVEEKGPLEGASRRRWLRSAARRRPPVGSVWRLAKGLNALSRDRGGRFLAGDVVTVVRTGRGWGWHHPDRVTITSEATRGWAPEGAMVSLDLFARYALPFDGPADPVALKRHVEEMALVVDRPFSLTKAESVELRRLYDYWKTLEEKRKSIDPNDTAKWKRAIDEENDFKQSSFFPKLDEVSMAVARRYADERGIPQGYITGHYHSAQEAIFQALESDRALRGSPAAGGSYATEAGPLEPKASAKWVAITGPELQEYEPGTKQVFRLQPPVPFRHGFLEATHDEAGEPYALRAEIVDYGPERRSLRGSVPRYLGLITMLPGGDACDREMIETDSLAEAKRETIAALSEEYDFWTKRSRRGDPAEGEGPLEAGRRTTGMSRTADKWRVDLSYCYPICDHAEVEVEADDKDDAADKAYDKARNGEVDWIPGDSGDGDLNVENVVNVTEEELAEQGGRIEEGPLEPEGGSRVRWTKRSERRVWVEEPGRLYRLKRPTMASGPEVGDIELPAGTVLQLRPTWYPGEPSRMFYLDREGRDTVTIPYEDWAGHENSEMLPWGGRQEGEPFWKEWPEAPQVDEDGPLERGAAMSRSAIEWTQDLEERIYEALDVAFELWMTVATAGIKHADIPGPVADHWMYDLIDDVRDAWEVEQRRRHPVSIATGWPSIDSLPKLVEDWVQSATDAGVDIGIPETLLAKAAESRNWTEDIEQRARSFNASAPEPVEGPLEREAAGRDLRVVHNLAEQIRADMLLKPVGPHGPGGSCAHAARRLVDSLKSVGFRGAKFVDGVFRVDKELPDVQWLPVWAEFESDNSHRWAGHCWVDLGGGYVADLTADQFNQYLESPMPEVYVGPAAGRYSETPQPIKDERKREGAVKTATSYAERYGERILEMVEEELARQGVRGASVPWDGRTTYAEPTGSDEFGQIIHDLEAEVLDSDGNRIGSAVFDLEHTQEAEEASGYGYPDWEVVNVRFNPGKSKQQVVRGPLEPEAAVSGLTLLGGTAA